MIYWLDGKNKKSYRLYKYYLPDAFCHNNGVVDENDDDDDADGM